MVLFDCCIGRGIAYHHLLHLQHIDKVTFGVLVIFIPYLKSNRDKLNLILQLTFVFYRFGLFF
jgi:hypothetical protein